MKEISLNGEWQFTSPEVDEWLPGQVPGEVFSDLIRNEEIPDPYYRSNELNLQWIGKTDWTYKRNFKVEKDFLAHQKQILDCKGLDTVSKLYINGIQVGRSKNMHRRYEFEVGEQLVEGENTLEIQFRSPVEFGVEQSQKYQGYIPDHRYLVDQPARQFIRKAQCHYGWDWGPCFPTMGIWRGINLVGFSAPRIRYTIHDQSFQGEVVTVKVRIGLDVPEKGTYTSRIQLAGETTTAENYLEAGITEIVDELTISNPELWWPAGYGEQPLYDLKVSIDNNNYRTSIGFRDLNLVREEDSGGESFYLEVNDTPIFAKGANWIPADSFPGRMTEERYENLLESASEANMNMVRVWGGGIYEDETFYEICDKKGIMVWQDFMFACSAYPADQDFLNNVEQEVRYQVRRLANHPSIALWCGDNENEWLGSRGDYNSQGVDWDKLVDDYEKLNKKTIEKVVSNEDPSRPFWPSSPSSKDKALPNDQSIGDTHYWDVWHGEKPFSDYLTTKPRFVSEFGYQSFPSPELLRTVMEEDDLNPTSPIMEHHQRHPEGNKLITRRITDHFRFPFSFEDFVYLSQIQQGLAIKTAVEHWRRQKPYCMGSIYWQLNDIWPVASWSSLEYGGGWKALHYMAKRFYQPVLVSAVQENNKMRLWITNDVDHELQGQLKLEVTDLTGSQRVSRKSEVEVSSLSSKRYDSWNINDLTTGMEKSNSVVKITFKGLGYSSSNFHFFDDFKSLSLPKPHLSCKVKANKVALYTTNIALFVKLSIRGEKGHFNDNYFHLLPGEEKSLSYSFVSEDITQRLTSSDITVTTLQETY